MVQRLSVELRVNEASFLGGSMSLMTTSHQRTVRSPVTIDGVGLHTGQAASMTILPADINSGIVFVRTDKDAGTNIVPAHWDQVVDTVLCTVIGNDYGVTVGTIEHLLAALRGCGVDNATIELDGGEVPIMDGSAKPFVERIEAVGTVSQPAARRAIRVLQPIHVGDEDRYATLTPAGDCSFSLALDFPDNRLWIARKAKFAWRMVRSRPIWRRRVPSASCRKSTNCGVAGLPWVGRWRTPSSSTAAGS